MTDYISYIFLSCVFLNQVQLLHVCDLKDKPNTVNVHILFICTHGHLLKRTLSMFDTQYELSVMEKIQIAESGSYLMTKKQTLKTD